MVDQSVHLWVHSEAFTRWSSISGVVSCIFLHCGMAGLRIVFTKDLVIPWRQNGVVANVISGIDPQRQ